MCSLGLLTIPWMVMPKESAIRLARAAAVVCLTACPRAIFAAKPSALWGVMAFCAHRGILSRECITTVKLGSTDAQELEFFSQPIRMFNRAALSNLCAALLGKLATLTALTAVSQPWHAAVLDLVVSTLINLNTAR